MVWYVRQKLTIELINPLCLVEVWGRDPPWLLPIGHSQFNPLTDCCHIYTHEDLSAYWFYEHERKIS